jgi:hypothetical protein
MMLPGEMMQAGNSFRDPYERLSIFFVLHQSWDQDSMPTEKAQPFPMISKDGWAGEHPFCGDVAHRVARRGHAAVGYHRAVAPVLPDAAARPSRRGDESRPSHEL